MKQKNKELQSTELLDTQDTVVDNIRKSQLSASNEFEYKKLGRRQEGLLDCSVKEEKESLTIQFDIHNKTLWTSIRKEKRELMICALIDVGRLQEAAQHYRFSLDPENLYYDIQGRVYVKMRDVYKAEEQYSNESFLTQYKSLIGCTLIKKYRFEDYDNGGLDLLKEDVFLNEIYECMNIEQIIQKLYQEYFRYRKEQERKYVEIPRVKNKGQKIALYVFGLLTAICVILLGYLLIWERPYQQAVITANESYLQSDYANVVKAMERVEVGRMNGYQKYILSVCCVKCESFSDDNMNNILNTITLNGDEKVMEYWIYINRLNTEMAADIAMQVSSNQLLYYAYLKEKAVIENSTDLTGQEKSERLSDIEQKLEPLEKEFSTLNEE